MQQDRVPIWGRRWIMARNTTKTWALAINGSRCRILRGLLSDRADALPELVLRSEARNLRDIMSDKPGRSFVSTGGGRRSAMEYASDPLAEDQREFIRQVIALLDSHRRAGGFDRLAVFAEHDMLGTLRQMMPQSLRDKVVREVPKKPAAPFSARAFRGGFARVEGWTRNFLIGGRRDARWRRSLPMMRCAPLSPRQIAGSCARRQAVTITARPTANPAADCSPPPTEGKTRCQRTSRRLRTSQKR